MTRLAAAFALIAGAAGAVTHSVPAQASEAACAFSADFEGGNMQAFYTQGAGMTLTPDAGYNSAGSARIAVPSAGALPWEKQFVRENVALTPGRRYALTLWAKASTARTTEVFFQQFDAPFTVVWKQPITIGTAWTPINITFDYPVSAVSLTPAFRINLGQAAGTVWIDNLSLCDSASQPVAPTPQPVSANCKIVNGHFESGTSSWRLDAVSPARATLATDVGARSATAARVAISAGGAIALRQGGINAGSGMYGLAFYGKSTQGQQLAVRIDGGGAAWQGSVRLPDPARDAAYKHYFLPVHLPNGAFGAQLSFDLGANSGTIWIDGVQLCTMPQTFDDDFNGDALDLSKWEHCIGYKKDCTVELYGGIEYYTPQNVTVSGGTMKQRFTRNPARVCVGCGFADEKLVDREYASAYVQTSRSFSTQYGYIEARMKMPSTKGTWPAFWLLPSKRGDNFEWPPEIDVLEYYPAQADLSWHTMHYKTPQVFHNTDGKQYQHPQPLSAGFHTYAVNWTPNEIIWYVDGMETYRSSTAPIQQPLFLIVSMGSGGIAGTPEADLSGGTFEIDYVRAFNNSESFGFDGGAQQPPVPPQPTVDMSQLTQRLYLPVTRRGR